MSTKNRAAAQVSRKPAARPAQPAAVVANDTASPTPPPVAALVRPAPVAIVAPPARAYHELSEGEQAAIRRRPHPSVSTAAAAFLSILQSLDTARENVTMAGHYLDEIETHRLKSGARPRAGEHPQFTVDCVHSNHRAVAFELEAIRGEVMAAISAMTGEPTRDSIDAAGLAGMLMGHPEL